MAEQNRARRTLFDVLTRVTHRLYGPMVSDIRSAMQDDPDFTARWCVFAANGGSNIRDQQDAAIISLLQAPATFPEYREAGRCVLLGSSVYDIASDETYTGLPPFRVFRIWEYMRSPFVMTFQSNEVARYTRAIQAAQALPKVAARLSNDQRKVTEDELAVTRDETHVGSPRLMRSIMTDYILALEADPTRWDGVALLNRRTLKNIYHTYHIPPSDRAQATLFDGNPPADSRLAVLKEIAGSRDVREQARLVIEHKIPYRIAQSVLPGGVSPMVGVAFIEVMSPTEALNSRAWVERSGLLEIPEVREAYTAKVAQAPSIASADHRVSAQGSDEGVQAAVVAARDKAAKKGDRIEGDVLIAVDHSASMGASLPIGAKLAARIVPLCDGQVWLGLHNDHARLMDVTGFSLSEIEGAMRGIRAGGQTRNRAALDGAMNHLTPDKICLVTDGGENSGSFARALQQHNIEPQLTMIRLPGQTDVLSGRVIDAGYRIDRFETTGEDYYVLDQVAAIMGGPAPKSIVERILETQLPRRA